MRSRRPASRSARSRVRTALPHILALTLALTVVLGGAVTAVSFGAAAQDGGQQTVSLGSEYSDTLSANDTADTYSFSVEQGEYVRLSALGGSPDVVGASLSGPSGSTLDSATLGPDTVLLGGLASSAGEYTVEFSGAESYTGNSSYGYSFEAEAASPDDYESNDQRASAAALPSGTADAVLGSGDTDYYVVSAAADTDISVSLDRDASVITNAYTLRLLTSDGTVLDESSARCTPGTFCDPEDLSANAPSDGDYYVQVSGGVTGFDDYTLSVDSQAPTQDSSNESGDDPQTANPGNSYEDTVSQSDSTDTYTHDVEQGEYVRLSALAGVPDVMSVTVTGPSGDTFDSAEMGPDAVLVGGQASTGGEYTVEFTYSGDLPEEDPQTYQFDVDTASADSYEPNDQMNSAALLSSGSASAVLGDDDTDYYAVSAAAGPTLTASVDKENVITNAFTVELLDSDGTVLDESSARCTPGTRCTLEDLSTNVTADGTYYVHVDGSVTGFNDYSLTVDAQPPTDDTETPDDTTDTPEETETPDDTTETPDETTETPDETTEMPDDGSSDDPDGDDSDGTDDTGDSDDDTSTPESGDGSDDADTGDSDSGDSDSSDGDDTNTPESGDGSVDDSGSADDSADGDDSDTSDSTDSSDTSDGTDDSDSTDDTSDSSDDSSSDDSDDTSSDTSSGTDDSETSDDSSNAASGADDSSDTSDDAAGGDEDTPSDTDSSDTDDTSTEASDDTDTSTPIASDDTTTSSETTTTDDGVVSTTTDGTAVPAGPGAPVENNSSDSNTEIVTGGTETDSSSGFGPGFGVAAALVALLATALLARRQQ